MEIKIYYSPDMNGMDEFVSYTINSFDELRNILPIAWAELTSMYDSDQYNSEAFIVACLSKNSMKEINCASFTFNDGELAIQNTEFIESNDPDIDDWTSVGLSIDKPYIGLSGLNEIISKLLKFENQTS